MALTLETAVRLIDAGVAKAKMMDRRVSIAVVDPRGDLIAFHRMDGARWTTVQIGQGKAFGSAANDESTTVLAERASRPVFQAMLVRHQGQMIFAQGGLPLREAGVLVGALGVSGGQSGPEDEEIAAAALDQWPG